MIGRDAFGERVRGSLEARGVDTRYVIEAADRATGVTVVMSDLSLIHIFRGSGL